MAKPSFIVVSKSYAVDEKSKHLSVFNIIEKFIISEIPKPAEPNATLVVRWEPMWLISEWTIDSSEEYDWEFEHDLRAFLPGKEAPDELTKGTFQFERG